MIGLVNTDNEKIELYKYRILKNFIKENIKINEEEKVETKLFLADDLANLIKYIDIKFYNELKQQRAEQ
jgi:hypothetical protein